MSCCGKGQHGKLGKRLSSLTKLDRSLFVKSFDYVIIGLDGTIETFLDDYEGIDCLITMLQYCCKKVCIATNHTMRPEDEIAAFLNRSSLCKICPNDILNPVKAFIHYYKHHMEGENIISLCSDEVNRQLRQNEVKITVPITERSGDFMKIQDYFGPGFEASAILVDVNFNFHVSHLMFALAYLKKNPECRIFVTQTDKMIPVKKNFCVVGPFGFVNALRKYATRPPTLFGKRGTYFHCLMKCYFKLGKPCRTLFIGENLEVDIQFGKECGFQTLLLTKCKNLEECFKKYCVTPDFYSNSLSDLVKIIQSVAKNLKSPIKSI